MPAAQVPQPYSTATPAPLPLPLVVAEPLARAPHPSALDHLPRGAGIGALRERAQLALR